MVKKFCAGDKVAIVSVWMSFRTCQEFSAQGYDKRQFYYLQCSFLI